MHVNEQGVAQRHQPDRLSALRLHRRDEDAGAAAGARQARLRCGLRRRAPRRGGVARQGARVLVPLGRPSLGPAPAAARDVAPAQRPAGARRDGARLPALQLDREGCLALCRPRSTSTSFRSTLRPSGRRSCATAACSSTTTTACRYARASSCSSKRVRFRTLGCWPLTAAIESDAADLDERCRRDARRTRFRAPGPPDRPRRGRRHGAQEAGGILLMSAPWLSRARSSAIGPALRCASRRSSWRSSRIAAAARRQPQRADLRLRR